MKIIKKLMKHRNEKVLLVYGLQVNHKLITRMIRNIKSLIHFDRSFT